MEQTKRTTVIELARAGHGPAAIIKLTGYPKSTVYDVYNRFMDEGKEERTPHKPRSDRKVTPTFLAGLKRTVEAKPDMHHPKGPGRPWHEILHAYSLLILMQLQLLRIYLSIPVHTYTDLT